MNTALSAKGLAKTYKGDGVEVLALRGVDLDVAEGELAALMGPSGCGKSTLLHLLAGLDRPTAGSIELGDARVESLSEAEWAVRRRREIGFVFQFFNLVQTLTVAENVELPALLVGTSRAKARPGSLHARSPACSLSSSSGSQPPASSSACSPGGS
jgi:putative ABC transport system ATP-binding protein